jgi:hypothetical protein
MKSFVVKLKLFEKTISDIKNKINNFEDDVYSNYANITEDELFKQKLKRDQIFN